jgi:hypothetical protein
LGAVLKKRFWVEAVVGGAGCVHGGTGAGAVKVNATLLNVVFWLVV